MTLVKTITRADRSYDQSVWEDPTSLDLALFSDGLFRSDAGFKAGEAVLVVAAGHLPLVEIEQTCAALALHRAILTLAYCDIRTCPEERLRKALSLVEVLNDHHQALLHAECERAFRGELDAQPPHFIHRYRGTFVSDILVAALNIFGEVSAEQIGVANDLAAISDTQPRLARHIGIEPILARGARDIHRDIPPSLRNPLAWYRRNPSADEVRLARYLTAYGQTPMSFIDAIEAIGRKEGAR